MSKKPILPKEVFRTLLPTTPENARGNDVLIWFNNLYKSSHQPQKVTVVRILTAMGDFERLNRKGVFIEAKGFLAGLNSVYYISPLAKNILITFYGDDVIKRIEKSSPHTFLNEEYSENKVKEEELILNKNYKI